MRMAEPLCCHRMKSLLLLQVHPLGRLNPSTGTCTKVTSWNLHLRADLGLSATSAAPGPRAWPVLDAGWEEEGAVVPRCNRCPQGAQGQEKEGTTREADLKKETGKVGEASRGQGGGRAVCLHIPG